MTQFQLFVIGFVQGVTEFLPISSSGHTALVEYFFHLKTNLSFDILLNTATLFSVLFYFKSNLRDFIKDLRFIIVGTIPAVIAGLFLKKPIESLYTDNFYLAPFFVLTGLFLLSTRFFKIQKKPLTIPKSLIIGFFQALAIIPSLSRSGSTIFAALFLGLSPEQAFRFSFFLLIPASFGAIALDARHQLTTLASGQSITYLPSLFFTFLTGLISLTFLRKVLTSQKIWYFGIYCLLLSMFVFWKINLNN